MSGEFPAMKFSPALLLLFWSEFFAKFADNFPNKCERGPGVQIHLGPHLSPEVSAHLGESLEIRACTRDLRSHRDPENVSGALNRHNLAKPIRARFR
jgi:hypothetical protein